MSQNQIALIRNIPTGEARTVYQRLQAQNRGVTEASRTKRLHDFHNIRLSNVKLFDIYAEKVVTLATDISASSDEKISDTEIRRVMLQAWFDWVCHLNFAHLLHG